MFLIRVELGFLGELDDAFLVLAPASRLRMARRYLRFSLGGCWFSLSGLLRVGVKSRLGALRLYNPWGKGGPVRVIPTYW